MEIWFNYPSVSAVIVIYGRVDGIDFHFNNWLINVSSRISKKNWRVPSTDLTLSTSLKSHFFLFL